MKGSALKRAKDHLMFLYPRQQFARHCLKIPFVFCGLPGQNREAAGPAPNRDFVATLPKHQDDRIVLQTGRLRRLRLFLFFLCLNIHFLQVNQGIR